MIHNMAFEQSIVLNKRLLISRTKYNKIGTMVNTHAESLLIGKKHSIRSTMILLNKLHHYGIRGIILDWFKSYLSSRKQTVSINGSISNYELISCGVSQGPVLGPLLFLIYINDTFNSSKVFSFHLFADDTSILCEHKSLNELQDIVNIELSKLSKWLNTNRLSLNVKKTNFVIFRPRQKKLPFIPSFYLPDNSNRLQQIKITKILYSTSASLLTHNYLGNNI